MRPQCTGPHPPAIEQSRVVQIPQPTRAISEQSRIAQIRQVIPCRSSSCAWHYAIEKGKPGLLSSTVDSTLELRLPDLERAAPWDDDATISTVSAVSADAASSDKQEIASIDDAPAVDEQSPGKAPSSESGGGEERRDDVGDEQEHGGTGDEQEHGGTGDEQEHGGTGDEQEHGGTGDDETSGDASGAAGPRLGEHVSGGVPHSVLVHLMYLQSYEHMGAVEISCMQGCSCSPQTIDAHR